MYRFAELRAILPKLKIGEAMLMGIGASLDRPVPVQIRKRYSKHGGVGVSLEETLLTKHELRQPEWDLNLSKPRNVPRISPFFCFRYSSSASMSSKSISDSQSSAHVEHSPVVPHSSQSGAPHMSQDKSWSSGISFPQSVHLTISCSRF